MAADWARLWLGAVTRLPGVPAATEAVDCSIATCSSLAACRRCRGVLALAAA